MTVSTYIFLGLIILVFYAYIGYGILLQILNSFKGQKEVSDKSQFLPEITFLVPAYNEIDFVDQKVKNSMELDYPKSRIRFVWITDGSNDGTENKLKDYPEIQVYHSLERRGKTAALNRAMQLIETDIVICSDANTLLNKEALTEMVKLFEDPKIGAVAGEKKIIKEESDDATSSGENFYWKYESWLKKQDAKFYSGVAVVGELFGVRKSVYSDMPEDTLLDDFVLSLKTIEKGYKIGYTKKAYATEKASASVKDEQKRKIRIAAGAFQTMFRYPTFLNPFKYPVYAFQFFSHKVLRWAIIPIVLPIIFLLNVWLTMEQNSFYIWIIILILQVLFYGLAFFGWMYQNKKTKANLLFIPFYIFMMNWSQILGMNRYFKGTQSQNWEKAARKK